MPDLTDHYGYALEDFDRAIYRAIASRTSDAACWSDQRRRSPWRRRVPRVRPRHGPRVRPRRYSRGSTSPVAAAASSRRPDRPASSTRLSSRRSPPCWPATSELWPGWSGRPTRFGLRGGSTYGSGRGCCARAGRRLASPARAW